MEQPVQEAPVGVGDQALRHDAEARHHEQQLQFPGNGRDDKPDRVYAPPADNDNNAELNRFDNRAPMRRFN